MPSESKIASWRELFEKTIEVGLGAALLTKESATKLVDDLIQRGTVTKTEGKKLVNDMLEKGKRQKQKMEELITEVVQRVMDKADVARQSHIEELERRIADLEERLDTQRDT
jgi:polyhydroxyalkanoate synthesis regulator phasin